MATIAPGTRLTRTAAGLPPVSFFVVSAIFHYLGPSLAVLLFARIAAPGVLWLRIAAAAAVFAIWRRPWRLAGRLDRRQLVTLLALGGVLAGMNALFYLAVARLPLATVGAIEFLGTVVLAALGARTGRNVAALALCVGGVAVLTAIQLGASPLGLVFRVRQLRRLHALRDAGSPGREHQGERCLRRDRPARRRDADRR